MLILAFESSAKAASVALCRDGHLVSQYSQCSGLTHSRTLPMAEDMLKNAELTIGDIDAFAVAHGPGSFTGIRIGVSTVKGLAWASDKPCVGVSTLEAMAWHGVSAGGYICPVMDARRSQVYNAIFKIEGGTDHHHLKGAAAVIDKDLASELRELDSPVFLVGDGAAITAAYLGGNNIAYRAAPENLVWQSAWGVAMAAQDKPFGSADDLLPVYLRLSQAERERQEKLAKT